VSESRYAVCPRADRDLDDQGFYYATEGSPDLGHRFLVAAHETFSLLAGQPNMGWRSRLKHPDLKTLRVFRVKGFERILILYCDSSYSVRGTSELKNAPIMIRPISHG
jgi:plasmid stabilization system protein ParE